MSGADLGDDSIAALIDSLDDSVEIPISRGIPCRLFIFRDPAEVPEWAQYVAAIATRPLGIKAREAIGALLLIKPDARQRVIYAATWGTGRFHLHSDRLGPDWGLRCALNLISGDKAGDRTWDPARVRALRSKRVSQNTLIAEIQSSRKTTIDVFPFSADVDQLRRVTGTPINSSRFGTTISGGVSIHVKRPDQAQHMANLCRDIERVHKSKDYQRHFGWIDNVSPVNDPILITKVYNEIVSALRAGDFQRLNLSPPTLIAWDNVAKFVYQWGHRKSDDVDDPSIDTFRDFLIKHSLLDSLSADDLREAPKLHALDDSHDKIQSWSIGKCLSGEFRIGTDAYILDDGALLFVAADYLRDLNQFTNGLPDPSQAFPNMEPAEKEDSYNRRISEDLRGALLLDKRTVRRPQATAIEVCDVATKARQLIHVKRGTSSSSLSHLFAQGVVSAELLHMDSGFRIEVKKLLTSDPDEEEDKLSGSGAAKMRDFDWLHGDRFEPHSCEVVYAIMTERHRGMRKDELPFFSKINLRMRCNELRRMGFRHSLVLIHE
jgi:uncharacterized protein (TIGR04141 family)